VSETRCRAAVNYCGAAVTGTVLWTAAMSVRAVLSTLVALGACTAYDPQLGSTPFFCGSADPVCPDGYTCHMNGAGSGVCGESSTGSGSGTHPGGNCTQGGAGQLALWDLTGSPGDQASNTASMTLAGVTAQPLTRSSALMATAGTGSINSSNWPTSGQADPSSYYTLALAAPSGCSLQVSGIMLDVKSSGTGPASGSLATNEDGFTQQVPVSTTAAGNVSISVTATSGMLELRVYGFAAQASTGTMRIENQLVITGSVQ
jgi:hypothetical protein